jgi:ABC-type nitrate/sulfonate/bicarbonate transport system substrate-binding protein
MRRSIAAGALALALSVAGITSVPAAAKAQQTLSASVGYYPGALISLPAFVAKDQKFFQKASKLIWFRSRPVPP